MVLRFRWLRRQKQRPTKMLQTVAESSSTASPSVVSASSSGVGNNTSTTTTTDETARRRSTFYVPLVLEPTPPAPTDTKPASHHNPPPPYHHPHHQYHNHHHHPQDTAKTATNQHQQQPQQQRVPLYYHHQYHPRLNAPSSNSQHQLNLDDLKRSLERIYNPDLSSCSFEWSLNDSVSSVTDELLVSNERSTAVSNSTTTTATAHPSASNRTKRYGVVLNGSINLDDDNAITQRLQTSTTSTPVKSYAIRKYEIASPQKAVLITTPQKSKTLPQNMSPVNTFPPKNSFLLKSTPKISFNYSSDIGPVSPSPKKGLSFIRRAHSTKLSRSNSLLKTLTSSSKNSCDLSPAADCNGQQQQQQQHPVVYDLRVHHLEKSFGSDDFEELVRAVFFTANTEDKNDASTDLEDKSIDQQTRFDLNDDDSAIHSDTSYEKACRRGSAPATPILGHKHSNDSHQNSQSGSRFTNFFSKRSNPLKRTKSVTKLERAKRGPGGLRGSRSHESLLSSHAVMSTIDLSCTGAVGVAPVHQSVLGRRHCFQVRGGPRGERYYSCGSRQERDLWIFSLRKSIAPNSEHTRRTDNSLKMWIYEGKSLAAKKKYFCEINLDKTLYGRTSVKLRTDLLFWGEFFDFPDIPDINVITVNVFREGEKKKKRDKHTLVGSVKIPIHEVTSRVFSEDWYPIISEKHDSFSRNSSKDPIPTLRIKCRFQSTDILPIEVYSDFLTYLKDNYKKVCEVLEPVIGVKAKEDIGHAMVMLMHAQGIAGAFLTDVVALDLLRVGDQRLTFRGNSLATKSMEAFLKLTGEQYLQDTLSTPISEVISSDRDCEVDPTKANGSLSRQQQALRNAVKTSWTSISESHRHFPPQLRDCFATFRERLQMLDREDMADNLISASIFLRFLCPAILSPSLFNITNELPSARATRNLTLVAKTLQTLANFTRFQGKENFMEFLNDFLEQEAPKMKEFLHLISTRSEIPTQETILDWSGYIDQGKQLSILHILLAECMQKLPANRQADLDPLQEILDTITKAKEMNSYTQNPQAQQQPASTVVPHQNQENHPTHGMKSGERGIIRGVLTPSSLDKNIFRYNDPTVSPLLKQTNMSHSSQQSINGIYSMPLQHSQSTLSIATNASSQMMHSNSNGGMHQLIPTTVQTVERKHKTNVYMEPHRAYNTTSHFYNNGSNVGRRSPAMRANTLPRNNISSPVNNGNPNANEVQPQKNLIQIGLDPSSAFVRKSPTPLHKPHNGSKRNLNGSQLSLLSDRSAASKNQLSLGIPHSEQKSNPSNMPMNLEDLDDLLKYAEENADHHSMNVKPKELLTSKGSNISIGHCSSGYQSITTQSQSSSPVELGQGPNLDFANRNIKNRSNSTNSYMQHHPPQPPTSGPFISTKYVNANQNNNNNIVNGNGVQAPLAFKNPLYQLQNHHHHHHHLPVAIRQEIISQKSSSLTPSSSEEQLCNDNFCATTEISGSNGSAALLIRTNGGGATSSEEKEMSIVPFNGSANRRVTTSNSSTNRIPRTNPLMQYKRDEPIDAFTAVSVPTNNRDHNHHHHHHQRYQRRLSLESARTLSDSSTDTEGNYHTEGKRRRAPRSVEQCEREIKMLKDSLDTLRHKAVDDTELRDSNEDLLAVSNNSDLKMRSIISRLITMEEDLRREQLKMSLALSHKQRVIEAQGQQIAALDAANNRLLSALSSLRQRCETQHQTNSITNGTQPQQPQQQQQSQSKSNAASHC